MTFDYQFRKSPLYDYLNIEEAPPHGRRAVYNFIVRSTPDPFMDVLDFPTPASCTPARNSTTTALQSLSLLNDPFVLQQADAFASRLMAQHPDDVEAQVAAAYRLVYERPPTSAETSRAMEFVDSHQLFHLCRAMFNSNEFLYVD